MTLSDEEIRPMFYYSCARCEMNFETEEDHFVSLEDSEIHLCPDCKRQADYSIS